ncbi:PREDICTED: reticulon-2-like, partial [Gekko japonicus]|uniref:Reticulon n=1 Tax=Gekko japonicus TaxID=146911 RepID=A0ABM1KS47_GEKJA
AQLDADLGLSKEQPEAFAGTPGVGGEQPCSSSISRGVVRERLPLGVAVPSACRPPTADLPLLPPPLLGRAQLDADLGLSKEQLERLTERVVFYTTSGTRSIQRLFLVDDLVESIKFAFLFYILTYVGAVFNGMTLLILGVISAFTFPLLYRQHQAQIDQYVGLVRNQLSNLRAKMLAKLPTAKAKAE